MSRLSSMARSISTRLRHGVMGVSSTPNKKPNPGHIRGIGKNAIPVGAISGNCSSGRHWGCTSLNCSCGCHARSL